MKKKDKIECIIKMPPGLNWHAGDVIKAKFDMGLVWDNPIKKVKWYMKLYCCLLCIPIVLKGIWKTIKLIKIRIITILKFWRVFRRRMKKSKQYISLEIKADKKGNTKILINKNMYIKCKYICVDSKGILNLTNPVFIIRLKKTRRDL